MAVVCGALDDFATSQCHTLIQLGSVDFFASLSVPCHKYYGDSYSAIDDLFGGEGDPSPDFEVGD